MQACSVGCAYRNCILDTKAKQTRLEIFWGTPRPSIWPAGATGASGWTWRMKMFYRHLVRGGERFDPPHRTVRVRENAITRSDGKFVKAEFSLVFSFLGGPWKSKANLQLFRGASKEIFKSFNHQFLLYRALYDRMVRGKYKSRLPLGFGTESHMEDFWWEIQDDKILSAIDTSYANNRWKGWSNNFEYYEGSMDVMLFIGLYIVLTRGSIKDLDQIKLLKSLVGPQLAALGIALPDDFVEDPSLKGMKESFKALESKREKKGGGLIIVLEVLANTTSRRLATVLHDIPEFVEDQCSVDRSRSKTMMGRQGYLLDMATGRATSILKNMWRSLEGPNTMRRFGFLRRSEVHGPHSLAEDRVVAQFAFELCLQITDQEIQTEDFFMRRAPYNFFGLVRNGGRPGANHEVVQRCI